MQWWTECAKYKSLQESIAEADKINQTKVNKESSKAPVPSVSMVRSLANPK